MWILILIIGAIVWFGMNYSEKKEIEIEAMTPDSSDKVVSGRIILDDFFLTFQDGVVYFRGSAKYGPSPSINYVWGYYEKNNEDNTWTVYDQDHRLKIGKIEEKTGMFGEICLCRSEYTKVMMDLENRSMRTVCEEQGLKLMQWKSLVWDVEWKCAWISKQALFDMKTNALIVQFEGDPIGAAAAFVCHAYDSMSMNSYGQWYPLRSNEKMLVEM